MQDYARGAGKLWKKIVESADTISYEKKGKSMNARIEARMEPSGWKVFVHYFNSTGSDYFEEYKADTKNDAEAIIRRLMTKNLSVKEIGKIMLSEKKKPIVDVQRVYQEYTAEKWEFRIRPGNTRNLMFMRSYESVEIDLVLHMKYKPNEASIVEEIKRIFNLSDSDVSIDIFYYGDSSEIRLKQKHGKLFSGKIEFGYGLNLGSIEFNDQE